MYTFGVNFEKGKSNCFKCDEGCTNLMNLTKFIANVSTVQEVRALLNEVDGYSFIFKKAETKRERRELELPEHFVRLDMAEGRLGEIMVKYMTKKRNLKLRQLISKNVGYCDDGEYEGYIIIPYYSFGKLVYFTGRKVIGNGPKFKNPEEEIYGVGKQSVIFNSDSLFTYSHIHLVESAINSLTMGDKSSALGGKDLSPYQKWVILKSPVERITLTLDPDAIKYSYEYAMELCRFKKVRLVNLPEGQDVNSFGKKLTLELTHATKYGEYKDFYKAYKNLKI
jgi:hypothetical protein